MGLTDRVGVNCTQCLMCIVHDWMFLADVIQFYGRNIERVYMCNCVRSIHDGQMCNGMF